MDSSDFLREQASKASSYAIDLDGKIGRDPAPSARGAHAAVYRGTLHPDGRIVAVKTAFFPDEKVIKDILREAHIASQMQHPNVLPLLGITTDFGGTVSLVTDWMKGGDAHHYVPQRDRDPRPLLRDIAQGLHYLHTHPTGPIIHSDLKGYNVLVSADGQAILADFGYSVLSNPPFTTTTKPPGRGTLKWKAPELVRMESAQTTVESDIWAFGMTMLELFTENMPYPNLTRPVTVANRILKGPPERPSNEDTCARMTGEWWQIISRCLMMEPSLRAKMLVVVEQIEQLKFPLSPCDVSMEAETYLVELAMRHALNLNDQIERDCSGRRSRVCRGTLLPVRLAVAIKALNFGIPDEHTVKEFFREARNWSTLCHPNVLSILGLTTSFNFTISIVTPWIDRGNACTYVQERDNDPRPLIKDIALGLRYLHSHPRTPIIHGDNWRDRSTY